MSESEIEQRGERRMANQLELKNNECRRFLDEMETVPVSDGRDGTAEVTLERMSSGARGHAASCADCRAALEEMLDTRRALQPMSARAAEAGPWFATRVMAAIRARENELEERRDGVWLGVRRLAPRLVAFCALLLVLGTTWAYQVRQGELARRLERSPGESVFESVPAPLNDDVLVGAGERR
jgi:hypothetical protein